MRNLKKMCVVSALFAATNLCPFEKASKRYALSFPRDHGAHSEFKTEWWYFTGNVTDSSGHPFGYQLTFFRNSILPASQAKKRTSAWGTTEFFMAHAAISDIYRGKHFSVEKLSRGVDGLASAKASPARIYLENWEMEGVPEKNMKLSASDASFDLHLTLENTKPMVLHGEKGFSQKSQNEGNASMYYSFTRLRTQGSIKIEGKEYHVSGNSWMDHEFSTSVLDASQVGWDWFSVQLQDGTELMLFKLRNKDRAQTYYSGTYVEKKGVSTSLSKEDFSIEERSTWTSPRSKAVYPSSWNLKIPKLRLELTMVPKIPDQEMQTSVAYWEGAVSVSAVKNGAPVLGDGYAELTGYAGSMQGVF